MSGRYIHVGLEHSFARSRISKYVYYAYIAHLYLHILLGLYLSRLHQQIPTRPASSTRAQTLYKCSPERPVTTSITLPSNHAHLPTLSSLIHLPSTTLSS